MTVGGLQILKGVGVILVFQILKEVFDGVLAFVDNGVFSAFDLKKERFLSVVSSSGQGIPSRGMLQRNDSLVWVISGSELHLMKRCASKEGELRLRVQEKYTRLG